MLKALSLDLGPRGYVKNGIGVFFCIITLVAVEAFIFEVFVFLSCFSHVSEPLPSVAPDQISLCKTPPWGLSRPLGERK